MEQQIKHCEYCHKLAEYVDSSEVYGKSYGMIYLCRPCQAWVGVHKGTNKPLGRLSNNELRFAKIKAHAAFDKIWREKWMTRKEAYRFLADTLGLTEVHIGESDIDMCNRIYIESLRIYNAIVNYKCDLNLNTNYDFSKVKL